MRDITTLSELERLSAVDQTAEVVFEMDEETFKAFYNRTARSLWLYLSRITGSPQMADDVMQEAFYRFLRAQRTYESDAHRRNSLFLIATNLVRDSRRRPALVELPDPSDNVALQTDGDIADRTARNADLGRAMARLKPRERQLLWLAYAQGETHRDIAEALGLKTGSIKLLLFRARRKMARLLRREKESVQ